jgi:hypothetical protein
MERRKWRIWILSIIAILLLCPFPTIVVPARRVLVINEESKPIRGVIVRQIWQNYSLEFSGHEEDLMTNKEGRVLCPERRIWSSLLARMVHPMLNILGQGVHASLGIHTDMFTLGDGEGVAAEDQPIQPLPGEVVFRHRRKTNSQ